MQNAVTHELRTNMYARRKSSPAITEHGALPLAALMAAAEAAVNQKSSRDQYYKTVITVADGATHYN